MRENTKESVQIRTRQSQQSAARYAAPAPRAKKRVKIDYSDMEVSEYYLNASKRCRAAKWISFLLLIAFLAVNLLFFRNNITYSNLMYLLRDLDTGAVSASAEFASITYNEESEAAFDIFKGRLAYASSEGFRLYNSTGARELDEMRYMQKPAIVSGDKYAIVYDVGGHAYSVFTNMACVLEETDDNIVEDICISDSGSYAVLTRSDEAKYLVSVYKENFRLQTKYYKDKYVVDMAMDEKGKSLAIVSADVSVSGISTEIMLCTTGTEETSVLTVENTMPLAVSYMENDRLLILCDTKLVYVADGKVKGEYSFSGGDPKYFYFADDCASVVCSSNAVASENEVFLFDSEGKLIYNKKISEKVNGVCCEPDAAYVLCDEKIIRIGADGSEKTAECDASVEAILPLYGTLLKCEKLGTSTVSFE